MRLGVPCWLHVIFDETGWVVGLVGDAGTDGQSSDRLSSHG